MNKRVTQHHQTFESLKHVQDDGMEFWFARELQEVLGYSRWEKFENVLNKAMTACQKSGQSAEDHFPQVVKMVSIGSGAQRETRDYRLSRYACYLIVQNADPTKPVIANGQTYFAIQTRRKELEDDTSFQQLSENQKRLMLRNELTSPRTFLERPKQKKNSNGTRSKVKPKPIRLILRLVPRFVEPFPSWAGPCRRMSPHRIRVSSSCRIDRRNWIMMNSSWKQGRIEDLIESLESGVSVNGENRIPSETEYAVLKVSAVTYGHFDQSAGKPIHGKELKRAKCTPKAGQIIISRASGTAGHVGASAFIDRDYPFRFLPDKLWQTVPNPDNDTNLKWLAYFLASPRTRTRILRYATGTNIKNITKSELLALPISIPSFSEQTAIADLLSTWDAAIEKTEKLITAKKIQRKGLMQQLLSGKHRLPGFAKPWLQVRMGEVFCNRTESACADLPLVSITGSEGVVFRDGLNRKDTSSLNKGKYLRICPGDVGYNTMRMWQGVSGLSQIEGIVSPAYTIVTPGNLLVPEFVALLFKFPPIVHLFYRYSQGLVSDTWNLKFRHFSEVRVRVPEKQEQEAIAAVFQPVDKELSLLHQQLVAFKKQKQGLMQKLLTGEWWVNYDEDS